MINPTQIENMSPENWQRFLHVHDRDEKHVERVRAICPSANSWPKRHFYGNSLCFPHILDVFSANLSKVESRRILFLHA